MKKNSKPIDMTAELKEKKALERRKIKRFYPEKELPFTAIPSIERNMVICLTKEQVIDFGLNIQRLVPSEEWLQEMKMLLDEKKRFEQNWRKRYVEAASKARFLTDTKQGKRLARLLEEKRVNKRTKRIIAEETINL